MPIEVWERTGDSGAFTQLGDTPPQPVTQGDASGEGSTGVPAANGVGEASSTPNGETSAPPSETPAGGPPEQAAPGGTPPGDEDDEPEPEVATVDYVARRIKRLTARQRTQERQHAARETAWTQERAHLQGQLEAMARMLNGAAPDLPQSQQPSGPPQAEQFQSHDDYVRAVGRYEAQQVRQEERQQTQAQQAQQDLMQREQAFAQAHPDYQQVVATNLRGKVAPHVQQALMMLPDGPALAYALATQPDTLQRLNTLPPPMMLMELGRLAPTSPPAGGSVPAPTTQAQVPAPLPPPLAGVNGQGTVPMPGWREGMSQEEFRRYRQQTSTLPVWKAR